MKGKRLTLLGTEVTCYHPKRDYDVLGCVCRACGKTDETLSREDEDGDVIVWVELPSSPQVYIGSAAPGESQAVEFIRVDTLSGTAL